MTTRVLKRQVGVCLGKIERPIGQLTYIKDGAREYSSFAYDNPWLASHDRSRTNARMISTLTNTARRLRRTLESMATPCSEKAYGA